MMWELFWYRFRNRDISYDTLRSLIPTEDVDDFALRSVIIQVRGILGKRRFFRDLWKTVTKRN